MGLQVFGLLTSLEFFDKFWLVVRFVMANLTGVSVASEAHYSVCELWVCLQVLGLLVCFGLFCVWDIKNEVFWFLTLKMSFVLIFMVLFAIKFA